MLKFVALALALGIAALLAYAATRPNTFVIERATTIKAPPERIYALIEDFHLWAGWSPYEKLDPKMTRTYSGPDKGVGATYGWASTGKAGVGNMTITEAVPARKVALDLNFDKPFPAHNLCTFTLQPQGEATRVTWTMTGPSPFISKLMGVVFNMDKMVGGDFERGLADMKALAEKAV